MVSDLHGAGLTNPAAFKAAIDSVAYPAVNTDPYVLLGGGKVVLPPGDYNFATTIQMQSALYGGITVEGAAWTPEDNSGVTFNSIQTDGSASMIIGGSNGGALSKVVIRNISFQSGTQAGPYCLGTLDDVPVVGQPNSGTGVALSSCLFDQCAWSCGNPSVQGMRLRIQDSEFRNCRWLGVTGRSQPVIYCDGGNDTFVGHPSIALGQTEKVLFSGITHFDQSHSGVAETAPFMVLEAWGTGLGLAFLQFEILRTEAIISGAFKISGASFIGFETVTFEDTGGITLLAPDLDITYNNNDSTVHYANSIIVSNGFGQATDSSSIPEIKITGNPSGGSGGYIFNTCEFSHFKATDTTATFNVVAATVASGSTQPFHLGANVNSISGVAGLSSGGTVCHNLSGTATVLSGNSSVNVTFATPEPNGDYDIVVGSPQGVQTTLASGAGALPMGTIHMTDSTGFPASGNVGIESTAGLNVVAYTGVSGNNLTGCTGGAGNITVGTKIVSLPTPGAQCRVGSVATFVHGFILTLEATTSQDLIFNWVMARSN
jgi:hypothetical protein